MTLADKHSNLKVNDIVVDVESDGEKRCYSRAGRLATIFFTVWRQIDLVFFTTPINSLL